jgi:cytochrome c-type biogenesis protein CcmH
MEEPLMNDEIQTLRKQLQQLQDLHGSGALDDAQYQQSKERLERKLVDAVVQAPAATGAPSPATMAPAKAVASPPPAAAPERRPSARLLAGVAAFVVVVSAAGYAWKGSPDKLALGPGSASASPGAGDSPEGAPHDTNSAQIAAMVDKLAARMKEHPDDAQGWVMLARSYVVLERYADAVPAYEQAVKRVADDPSLLADYADALGMRNNKVLGPDAMQLIERALTIDAGHLKALSLAGSAAFAKKDYATAVSYWERLTQAAPAESTFLPDVRAGIAEARELGKLGPGPVAAQAVPVPSAVKVTQTAQAATPAGAGNSSGSGAGPAAANATVSGTVSLSKALAAQASPNDTVFIFARAAEGPRMPLAILRKQVKDLPLQFKLDDSLAMSPAMKISSFPKVIVGARVSKSGEAMPQKGDLTGISGPVSTGSTGLKIEIDQVINP